MHVVIVTPAPQDSTAGNRVTAIRWQQHITAIGHECTIVTQYDDEPCDVLIALHARRSHASIVRYREHGGRLAIVMMTGTDLYGDLPRGDTDTLDSLERATRIVVLQEQGIEALPIEHRAKARVIYQSVERDPSADPAPADSKPSQHFEVCLLGHLREVKDPRTAIVASREFSSDSTARITHLGRALDAELEELARAESASNPHYRWLGEQPRARALECLRESQLLLSTSHLEGGANAIAEAIAFDVPVVATRIAGNIGMLGADYPAYFDVGDTHALARSIERAERDPTLYAELRRAVRARRDRFDPARERRAINELWASLDG